MSEQPTTPKAPGACIPWDERLGEYAKIMGDEKIVKQVWEQTDQLAYLYIWSTLTLF